MSGRRPTDAKRKLGGHFGAAVGASTKRGRAAGWRDEVDEVAAAEPAGHAEEDSGSEVALDPGTPLPSESEEEPQAQQQQTVTSNDAAAAAAAVPAAAAAAASGAAGPDAPGAPEAVEASGAAEPTSGSPAAGAEGGAAPAEGASATAAGATSSSGAPAASGTEAPAAAPAATTAASLVCTLELLVSDRLVGSASVLLREGLTVGTEKRLAACIPPAGGAVDELVKGAICTFGGHAPLAGASRGRRQASKAAASKAKQQATAEGAAAELAPEDLPDEAVIDEKVAAASSSSAAGAGLLWQHVEGPGLVLTLGSTGAQLLEGTHTLVGPLLTGRRLCKHLQVLAPIVGGLAPPGAVLRVAGPKPGEVDGVAKAHPFLLLEPAPANIPSGVAGQAFCLEEVLEDTAIAEELELVELELGCRDAEVAELKQMSFNRERQKGVEDIIETLENVEHRLAKMGPPIPEEVVPTEAGGVDDAHTHQRWWLMQRVRQLLRVLKKLR